jgi:hypothetical protein
MITQEFQWSRSLITIFLQHSPTYVPLLPWRLRFQFVFCQLWYPLVALIFLSMSIIPIVALAFDVPMANVLYLDFLLHSIWMPTAVLILLWWISWQGWLRPANTKIISWEGMLYIPARWPWWLVGTTAAVYDTIRGSTVQFRVTPKGTSTAEPLPLRVVAPYAILAAASGLAVIAFGDARDAAGFYVLALLNCILYAALVVVVIAMHAVENPRRNEDRKRETQGYIAQGALVGLIIAIPLLGAPMRVPAGLNAIMDTTPVIPPATAISVEPRTTYRQHMLALFRPRNSPPLPPTRTQLKP